MLDTYAMKRIAIVTGACGFIGSHLVDELLEHGYRVIGIDNLRTGRRENIAAAMVHSDFRLVIDDIRNESLAEVIGERSDLLFHLAAISSVRESIENPILINDVNTRGTLNVLEVARSLGVKRVVFSSSAAVYGDPEEVPISEDAPYNPLSPYAASKIGAEMYLKSFHSSFGLDYAVLRYFNVYGPRQAYSAYSGVISIFINQALDNGPITIEGDGKQTRSFIHVEDVVRATRKSAELHDAKNTVMNISGLEQISILDLAQRIKKSVEGCSSGIAYAEARVGDVQDSIGHMDKTRTILDFTPEVPLPQGLRDTVEWYRDSYTR